jgi:XTP/dITP diphosphohydrolase
MLPEIVFASRNKNKLREIQAMCKDLGFHLRPMDDFPGCPDVEEDQDTFEGNALKKAREVFRFTGKLSLADDSGLMVDALEGAPGVKSARFAGEDVSYRANNLKLLDLLKDIPREKRTARFISTMALVGNGIEKVVEGVVDGKIILKERGNSGFGYDPLFIAAGYDRTFAEMTMEEKNKISHRSIALEKMHRVLKEILGGG